MKRKSIIVAALSIVWHLGCKQPNTQTGEKMDSSSAEVSFKKHTLTRDFISEGVSVGDVDRDGAIDVMAGAYWFKAPNWEQREIYPGKTYDPGKQYSDSFLNFSLDVNQDGWIDHIVIDFPGKVAHWYENPQNKGAVWNKHPLNDSVKVGNESPHFVDIDNDGRKDLLCADTDAKQMVWLRAPGQGSDLEWEKFTISEKDAPGTDRFSHGLGFGDINGDRRPDVIIKQGWWESPSDPKQPNWTFHPAELGEDCSHMHAFDVNDDGTKDVISASAHKYGIWWHEQTKGESSTQNWETHQISNEFSQSHSSSMTDVDEDGVPDLIVGKRFFAHNDTDNDPGAREPAVLFWFGFTPGKQPYFHPHLIDSDSGAGLNIVAEDVTKDGNLDIVIANKKGVFVFERVKQTTAQ